VIRLIALIAIYARRSFLEWMGFRSFLFTIVINQAVAPLLGLAIWSAAMPERSEITTYFVALLAVQLATGSQEYYSVAMRIYEGHLNDDLLRPHSMVIAPMGESIAFRSWNVVAGIPILAIVIVSLGVSYRIADIVVAIPALILAATLRFVFDCIFALSALWTQEAGGITELGSTLIFLLGGVAVPIMVFPDQFRPWGEALPFRAMLGFPAEIASGELNRSQVLYGYGWQIAWLVVLVPVASFVWQSGIRRFTALGG
jgi:ABC-2 type transport system permease protein